jgi:hypothetical protein
MKHHPDPKLAAYFDRVNACDDLDAGRPKASYGGLLIFAELRADAGQLPNAVFERCSEAFI